MTSGPAERRLLIDRNGETAEAVGVATMPGRVGSVRSSPLRLIAVAAVGSAALTLGLFWAWQSWSARSAVPIDDRLPFLVERAEGASPETSGAAADISGDSAEAGSPTPALGGVPDEPAVLSDEQSKPSILIVHVSGDVGRPGVVEVTEGDRVNDAIEAAGGANDSADLDRVNLAAPVVDGERIHVPAFGEIDQPVLVEPIRPAEGDEAPTPGSTPVVVDLNRAGLAELESLSGVGPATAQAIIDTREARGPFRSVDELLEVDGIGPGKLEELRPHVWVQAS